MTRIRTSWEKELKGSGTEIRYDKEILRAIHKNASVFYLESNICMAAFFVASVSVSNFRNEVYPNYKANRADARRPVHYEKIRSHLINRWNAEVVNGIEADDAIGIYQEDNTVICTIDKDLDCIPGPHYNFVKGEYYEVSPSEAVNHFCMQMLAGDGTDNICALRGVGMKTAQKRLDKYDNYADGAIEEYKKYYGDDWEEAWDCNEQLIGIRYEAETSWGETI